MVLTAGETKETKTKELLIIDADAFIKGSTMSDLESGVAREVDLTQDSFIIIITGRRGSGKTTAMTFWAIRAAILYGIKIISTYPIEFYLRKRNKAGASYLEHIVSEPLDFTLLVQFDEAYTNAIILIDESPDIISHMASMGWKNRLVNAFTRQLRKNRITLFLGAQDSYIIDKSMRWQCDIEIKCSDLARYGSRTDGLLRGSVISQRFFDKSGVWTNLSSEERLQYGLDPCIIEGIIRPCILWGDKEHIAVFDSWHQIDIFENLRKYDLQLSSIKVGDGSKTFEDRYPVDGAVLVKALAAIKQIRDLEGSIIYQKEFFSLCEPLSIADKNNLGRILGEYGVKRGGGGGVRYYHFGEEFRLDDFKALANKGEEK